jgi:hypothetical protein
MWRTTLATSNDATTDAVILKMMEFYFFDDPEIIEAILARMTSPSKLVRILSYERFHQYTQCPLMEEWSRQEEPTSDQIEAVRQWWRDKRRQMSSTP